VVQALPLQGLIGSTSETMDLKPIVCLHFLSEQGAHLTSRITITIEAFLDLQ
jgi:hypothetical protein